MFILLVSLILANPFPSDIRADNDPVAKDMINQMKRALEPFDTIYRKVRVVTTEKGIALANYEALELRKKVAHEKRLILVLMAPEKLKDTCFLFSEDKTQLSVTAWVYSPTSHGVNKVENVMMDEAFLNSEFSYADMLLFNRRGQHKLITDHKDKNPETLVLETLPEDSWYYSKIITVISRENNLPIKKYYYVKSGDLWKIMEVTDVSFNNGKIDKLKMKMEGQMEKKSSTYTVESSDYSITIPDDYFTPEYLPKIKETTLIHQK